MRHGTMSTKIGHFEILSELSKSATGVVYKANDPETVVRLEWLKTLVASASARRHFSSSAACSPKADNWIAFKATV